jgi:murein DD-endopeptidase MepM/ murein hydrolase activator NlpD
MPSLNNLSFGSFFGLPALGKKTVWAVLLANPYVYISLIILLTFFLSTYQIGHMASSSAFTEGYVESARGGSEDGDGDGEQLPGYVFVPPDPNAIAENPECPTNGGSISGYCDYNHSSTPGCAQASIQCWDPGANNGDPVFATCSGVVRFADTATGGSAGYGNLIILDCETSTGTPFSVYYGHLQSFSVVAGDEVSAGDHIGAANSTGNSTGPHLHYEVRGLIGYVLPTECYSNLTTLCAPDYGL